MKQQENNFEYNSILNLGFWKTNLPNLDNKTIIDNLYKTKQTTPSVLKSNMGGYQTPSDLHSFPLFFPLIKTINSLIFKLTNNPNFKIIEMWGNISSPMDYNYIHNHGQTVPLSGILYLNLPPKSGKLVFVDPLDSNKNFPIMSNPNDLIIFQSNLPHFVEPNLSQEDRISIAFNIN